MTGLVSDELRPFLAPQYPRGHFWKIRTSGLAADALGPKSGALGIDTYYAFCDCGWKVRHQHQLFVEQRLAMHFADVERGA